MEILQNLLREDAYLDYSRKFGKLRHTESIARTLADITRIVRHISTMKLFRGAFQYGVKLVSVATDVPAADLGQFSEFGDNRFPLAIDSSPIEKEAKAIWSKKSNGAVPLWYQTEATKFRVKSIEDQEFTPIIVKVESDLPGYQFKVGRVIGFHGAGDSSSLAFDF